MDKISGVYSIKNITSGKLYIGSSIDIRDRFLQHKRRLKRGTHPNPKLQSAFNKHGIENFIFEIIEVVHDLSKLTEREQYHLNEVLSANSDNLWIFEEKSYNILRVAGNLYGFKHAEDSKIKMSKTKSNLSKDIIIPSDEEVYNKIYKIDEPVEIVKKDETNPFYGKKHSDHTKSIMSNYKKGSKNFFYGTGPMVNKSHSNLSKKKISISNSGKNNKNSKPIIQISVSGEVIREYYSSGEASKMTGISQGNINLCCNGLRRSASGYIWKFKSEFDGQVPV